MEKNWQRFSRILFILIPILLMSVFVIQQSSASALNTHTSHELIAEAMVNYSVEPLIEGVNNLAVQSPFLSALAQTSTLGQWSGVVNWPLVAIHNQMMADGRIFMWDRENDFTRSFRIYNPSTGSFSSAPNLPSSVFCAGFDLLLDGRVMLNGGHLVNDSYGLVETNIYNPANNSWTRGGDMTYARWYPTTVTLGDGRVLTGGGEIRPGVYATIPEIFNPSTNTWTTLPNASLNIRNYPNLHLLPNGKILLVYTGAPVRMLDTTLGRWTSASSSTTPPGFTSVQYRPGKIMQSGKGTNTSVLDANVASPAWRTTQPMAYPRWNHNLIVLPDGNVLAVGGSNNNSNLPASGVLPAEMWNANTETWTTLPSMATPRMYHSMAMLLPDGRVVVAGGGRATATQTTYLNAEFYSPPYLFRGARPSLSGVPAEAAYNSIINASTNTTIASAVLISNPSVTHAFNMNQRYVPLTFTQSGNQVRLQIPSNSNLVPPGHYMLFLLNGDGVPSVARIIKISGTATQPPVPTATYTPSPLPPVPTATYTPTFTPTPVPGGGGGTITVQINSGGNDVNEVTGVLYSNETRIFLGNATASSSNFTGLRFTNLAIPRGATITAARLEFYSTEFQSVSINLQMAADDVDNSVAFNTTNRPSMRTLTTARVNHSSNVPWNANTWYNLGEIRTLIQEVTSRPNWQSGNSLSIIMRGTAGVFAPKIVRSFEGGAAFAARLVVTYTA